MVNGNYNMVGVAVAMVIPTMHEKSRIDLHNDEIAKSSLIQVSWIIWTILRSYFLHN